jgi:hypothetical protein
MRAVISNVLNKIGIAVLAIIVTLVTMLLFLFSSFSTRSSIIDSLLKRRRYYWLEGVRVLFIIILLGIIFMPNSPESLQRVSELILLGGILYAEVSSRSKGVLVAREAKELSSSMAFLRAIENIERDGTTRELLIQKYRHEERREELSGADIVNSSKYLNMLELDDSLFCYPNIIYRQSVVATAMMIVGINRVVVRDLEGSVLYTSKGVTLIPLNKKFKILIELAKKLNYEVRIEG